MGEKGGSNMFWGLIVKPGKRYATTWEEGFRVSKACLEPSSIKGNEISTLYLECDNQEEFILVNLREKNLNETLDLTFSVGEKICFKVEGPGTVHLTGYLIDDDLEPPSGFFDDSAMDGSEDSEEEVEEDNKIEEDPAKVLKRKQE